MRQAASFPTSTVPLIVFGYSRLGITEREFINNYAAPGSTVYLPHYGASRLFEETRSTTRFFEDRGWIVVFATDYAVTVGQTCADAFLGLGSITDNAQVCSYPTLEAEVRGVLSQIKVDVAEGTYSLDDAVIVTRSESTYDPIVREIAWEYQIPVQTHDSVPILSTRFGQWLGDLLTIVDSGDFGFELVARFLHSPLGTKFIPDALSQSEQWSDARSIHAHSDEEWAAHGAAIEALRWPERGTRAEWSQRIVNILRFADIQIRMIGSPQDLAAFEHFNEALTELALPANDALDRAEIIEQVRDLLSIVTVQSSLTRSGVQVHTPLALFGACIPHVFVLGASEGMLPRAIRDESFLDFHERKILADSGVADIETAAGAACREALSFYSLLLVPLESVHFSYPRLNAGVKQELSPLVERIGIEPVDIGNESDIAASALELAKYEISSTDEQISELAKTARFALAITSLRESGERNDPFTGATGLEFPVADRVFSPAQLTTFGQCPYAWFSKYVLKIADPIEASDDLDPSAKGTLFHGVLSRAAAAVTGQPNQRESILACLSEAFDEVANGMPELRRLPGWEGRRLELLKQLHKAVEGPEFLLDGSTILAVEQSFTRSWNQLQVRGRIDRIDQLDDHLLVVDYKTSSSKPRGAKGNDGKLSLDVQLPVYMAAGATDPDFDMDVTGGYYYSLANDKRLGTPYGLPDGRHKITAPPYDQLRGLAEQVRQSLATAPFPVAPDKVEFGACKYCDLDPVCRKGPHVHRTEAEAS